MIIVVLFLFVVLVVWWRSKPGGPTPPAYPGGVPLLGHINLMTGDAATIFINNFIKLFEFCNENDGLAMCSIGTHTVYVVTDPDDSLTVSNTCLQRPYMYQFLEGVKQGLLVGDVEKWHHHRKLLNPVFNNETLQIYSKVFDEQARQLVQKLSPEVDKEIFDPEPYITNFTLEVTCQTSLGLLPGHGKVSKEYVNAVKNIAGLLVKRLQKLWLHSNFIYQYSSLKKTLDDMRIIVKETSNSVIKEHKEKLKHMDDELITDGYFSSDKFKPFLDQLLLIDAKRNVFTEEEISDHVDTMITAGFDTTATALLLVLVTIGSHKQVQDLIYKELIDVIGDKDDIGCDISKLVYLDAAIKETCRLYPPAPMIARKIDKDVKLRNYTIRAGSTCMIGIYGNNRHPIWGPDANEFKPERWLTPELASDAKAFASFGFGKRNCIGKHYAMMVIKTTLAHLLRRYEITAPDANYIKFKFNVLLKPIAGHHISLKLRK